MLMHKSFILEITYTYRYTHIYFDYGYGVHSRIAEKLNKILLISVFNVNNFLLYYWYFVECAVSINI